jgi:hypothetical protein
MRACAEKRRAGFENTLFVRNHAAEAQLEQRRHQLHGAFNNDAFGRIAEGPRSVRTRWIGATDSVRPECAAEPARVVKEHLHTEPGDAVSVTFVP